MEREDTVIPHVAPDSRTGWLPDAEWFDRCHKALVADFGDNPDTKPDMVQFMFDAGFYDPKTLTPAAGLQRFNDCLNPNRAHRFKIVEVLALARRFRRVAFVSLIMREMGAETTNLVELLGDLIALQKHNAERLAQIMAGTGYGPLTDPRMHPRLREHPSTIQLSAGDES